MSLTVHKRTFQAKSHPKGSEERKRLNLSIVTSEYMTGDKYAVVGDHFSNGYKTKELADSAVLRMNSKNERP